MDLALLEGAVSTPDDVKKALLVRSRSRLVVALGDCAVGNGVAGMRNHLAPEEILDLIIGRKLTIIKGFPPSIFHLYCPTACPCAR